jgi:hypothetical protein
MNIRKLNKDDVAELKTLFYTQKYMGSKIENTDFFMKDHIVDLYHAGFCSTYLTGLKNYHAFGYFDDDGKIQGAISCYQSPDEPCWYGTNIRSASNKQISRELLDHMIKFNEEQGRLKFYTLWNAKHAKLLRRFTFSKWADERYDYYDEMIIPAKHKCLYTTYWQVLFNRVLLPHDTIIRCTFLKQQYRAELPIGGNI